MGFLSKIKPLKLIGKALQVAAPIALAVVDPVAGIVGVVAGGGAVGTKILGKLASGYGLGRPHKVASPVAAIGLPKVLIETLAASGVDLGQSTSALVAVLERAGAGGVDPWLAVGVFLWFMHQIGNNVEGSGNDKKGFAPAPIGG